MKTISQFIAAVFAIIFFIAACAKCNDLLLQLVWTFGCLGLSALCVVAHQRISESEEMTNSYMYHNSFAELFIVL